jgi:hypothetical protein
VETAFRLIRAGVSTVEKDGEKVNACAQSDSYGSDPAAFR